MTAYVFDIEADGLNPSVIFCVVALEITTGQMHSFGPDKIKEGIELLKNADKLIGHNILGYDMPVIKKLHGVDLSEGKKIVDTLVLSRLFNPTREGGHGLESWGYRLRHRKLEFKEFERFTPEMLTYCENDVSLNNKVYKHLKIEAQGFSAKSITLEHEVYKILNAQRDKGFLLDVEHAMKLVAELSQKLFEAEALVQQTFLPKDSSIKLLPTYTKAGKMSKMCSVEGSNKKVRLSDEEYNLMVKNQAPMIRSDEIPFNLGSRKQIGEYLIEFGWKPTQHTPTGQPIVDEKTLSKIENIPEAKTIAEYLMIQKRLAQVNSWLEQADQNDNRVRGYVNTIGAVTGRMTHSSPNMAQVPSCKSPYGSECRSCWTVDTGNKLIGIDASGLELRMLAHYMDDEAYTYELLNGDIHTSNQNLAGLKSRNQAKTFIYALLYGAGDAKLGSVVGGNTRDGTQLRERFFDNLPAFKTLKDRVARASKKGYLKGLDGRKLFVRSEHSALNTLLQGAGAIVMKEALVVLNDWLFAEGITNCFVANVHDEWQIEIKAELADRVGILGVKAIEQAGRNLNLKCELTGEYNVGNNWAETH
jgi:DNA polymerase I